jgi:Flp pilus assembly protein TadG
MFTRIAALARKIRESREGAVAIHMALIFIAMLGMVGLATDIGFVMYKHRQMQVAADAAAYSAAIAISTNISTNNPTNITTQANGVAGWAGFVNGANSVTITVNNPPATGPNTTNTSAVEVIIQQPQTLPLVGLLYSGAFNLGVRAVAIGGAAGGGGGCALQKDPTANPGVTISNGATVDLVGCGLNVCSTATTGNDALSMSGGTHLNLCTTPACTTFSTPQTASVSVAGAASVTNGAQINNVNGCSAANSCKTSQACAANLDPYANVVMPTSGGCSNGTNKSYGHSNSGLQTLNPGVWCNGVSFTNDAQIKLNPGVYYVNGGNFNVGGAVQMTGTGVTIILTGSGSNYANATIGNGATVTLAAPTTGTTAGLAVVGDPNAPSSTPSSSFGGGATMNITGALYFPTETVQFTNGIANPSGCTQLIAGTMVFNGGASFNSNCPGTGTKPINPSVSTALVE